MSIKDLEGADPVGAVLTIGHKGPRGNPEHNDRFYLVETHQGSDGRRAEHPSFRAFNAAQPDVRKVIRGNLVHATTEEAFRYNLKAQVLPGVVHPGKAPACSGDGVKAERWTGTEYQTIECPHDRCQFRQPRSDGKPTPCKPWMQLLFRIRWPDGRPEPSMLVKFTSGAWSTTKNVLGLFESVQKQADQLHIDDFSLFGLPFNLLLTKKKSKTASGGRAFPVVSVSMEGDMIEFLLGQQASMEAIGGRYTTLLSADQTDPEEQYRDQKSISGPVISVPAAEE